MPCQVVRWGLRRSALRPRPRSPWVAGLRGAGGVLSGGGSGVSGARSGRGCRWPPAGPVVSFRLTVRALSRGSAPQNIHFAKFMNELAQNACFAQFGSVVPPVLVARRGSSWVAGLPVGPLRASVVACGLGPWSLVAGSPWPHGLCGVGRGLRRWKPARRRRLSFYIPESVK